VRDSKTEFEMLGCEKNLSKYGRYGAGVLLQQDSYLQALVRAVQQADTDLQYPAFIILARLITHDPSTHYIVAQVTHPMFFPCASIRNALSTHNCGVCCSLTHHAKCIIAKCNIAFMLAPVHSINMNMDVSLHLCWYHGLNEHEHGDVITFSWYLCV